MHKTKRQILGALDEDMVVPIQSGRYTVKNQKDSEDDQDKTWVQKAGALAGYVDCQILLPIFDVKHRCNHNKRPRGRPRVVPDR